MGGHCGGRQRRPSQIVVRHQLGALHPLLGGIDAVARHIEAVIGEAQRNGGGGVGRHRVTGDKGRQKQILRIDQKVDIHRPVPVAQLAAADPAAGLVIVAVVVRVFVEAAGLADGLGAQTHRHVVAERVVHHADEIVLVELVRIGLVDEAGVVELGLGRDDVHHAEFGVPTIEGALRPLQDLHPIDIEEVDILEVAAAQGGRADIGAVDEQADAGIGPGRPFGARAANGNLAEVGRLQVVEPDARHGPEQVAGARDRAHLAELSRGHRRDGGGNIAHLFRCLARRDDDGLDCVGV